MRHTNKPWMRHTRESKSHAPWVNQRVMTHEWDIQIESWPMNETYKWVMTHEWDIQMSHDPWMRHTHESWPMNETYKWVEESRPMNESKSHDPWMRRTSETKSHAPWMNRRVVTHVSDIHMSHDSWDVQMSQWVMTHEWDILCYVWMRHTNESMSHDPWMIETYKWVNESRSIDPWMRHTMLCMNESYKRAKQSWLINET